MDKIEAKIKYEGDSKRFHRYRIIHSGGEVVGSVYFSKDLKSIPKKVVLDLVSKK